MASYFAACFPRGAGLRAEELHLPLDLIGHHHTVHTEHDGRLVVSVRWRNNEPSPIRVKDDAVVVIDGHVYSIPSSDTGQLPAAFTLEFLRNCCEGDGVKRLSQCSGDFAMLIWERRLGRLVCYRDPLGTRPLYYHWDGSALYCGGSLNDLLRMSQMSSALDEIYLARWALGLPVDTRPETPYRSIRRVPRGHVLTVGPECDLRLVLVDDLVPKKTLRYADTSDYLEHFSELLSRAVERRVAVTRRIGIQLSGGLDSSTVMATAARTTGTSKEIHPVHFYYSEFRSADERKYARSVGSAWGVHVHELCADSVWPFLDPTRYFNGGEEPTQDAFYGVLDILFAKLSQLNVDAVFDGQGGDELLNGSLLYLADLLRQGRPMTAILEAAGWAKFLRSSIGHVFGRHVVAPLLFGFPGGVPKSVPSWFNPSFSKGLCLRTLLKEEQPVKNFSDLATQAEWQSTLLMTAPMWMYILYGRPLGVETLHPLLDREIIEFSLSIPPSVKLRPGVQKFVLRSIGHNLVPDEVRLRTTKGSGEEPFIFGIRQGFRQIERIISEVRQFGMRIHDEGALLRELTRIKYGQLDRVAKVNRSLCLELWLHGYFKRCGGAPETSCASAA